MLVSQTVLGVVASCFRDWWGSGSERLIEAGYLAPLGSPVASGLCWPVPCLGFGLVRCPLASAVCRALLWVPFLCLWGWDVLTGSPWGLCTQTFMHVYHTAPWCFMVFATCHYQMCSRCGRLSVRYNLRPAGSEGRGFILHFIKSFSPLKLKLGLLDVCISGKCSGKL